MWVFHSIFMSKTKSATILSPVSSWCNCPSRYFCPISPKKHLGWLFQKHHSINIKIPLVWGLRFCLAVNGRWPKLDSGGLVASCTIDRKKKKKKAYHSQTVPTISWLHLSCQIKFHAAGLSRRQKGSREGILCIIVMKRERGDEMGEEKHSHMKFQTMDTFII